MKASAKRKRTRAEIEEDKKLEEEFKQERESFKASKKKLKADDKSAEEVQKELAKYHAMMSDLIIKGVVDKDWKHTGKQVEQAKD